MNHPGLPMGYAKSYNDRELESVAAATRRLTMTVYLSKCAVHDTYRYPYRHSSDRACKDAISCAVLGQATEILRVTELGDSSLCKFRTEVGSTVRGDVP
jgi:hypothetical protein